MKVGRKKKERKERKKKGRKEKSMRESQSITESVYCSFADVQLFGILWYLNSVNNVPISPECRVMGTDPAGEISVPMCCQL